MVTSLLGVWSTRPTSGSGVGRTLHPVTASSGRSSAHEWVWSMGVGGLDSPPPNPTPGRKPRETAQIWPICSKTPKLPRPKPHFLTPVPFGFGSFFKMAGIGVVSGYVWGLDQCSHAHPLPSAKPLPGRSYGDVNINELRPMLSLMFAPLLLRHFAGCGRSHHPRRLLPCPAVGHARQSPAH